jgi:ACT domain-containing protein
VVSIRKSPRDVKRNRIVSNEHKRLVVEEAVRQAKKRKLKAFLKLIGIAGSTFYTWKEHYAIHRYVGNSPRGTTIMYRNINHSANVRRRK